VLFLECGSRPQDATFLIDGGTVVPDQSFVLDRVFLETRKLIKPLIKLEFSSLVAIEATGTEVTASLLFSLVKVCGNTTDVLQTWEYVVSTAGDTEATVASSQPFTVTFCDRPLPCDPPFGCCEYRMIVEGVSFTGTFTSLRVIRPDLSAIVQGAVEA